MSIQGQFRLSSTRGKSELLHVCRVKLCQGTGTILVAEVYPARLDSPEDYRGFSDPLSFIRKYPLSRSRAELVRQLKANKLTPAQIAEVLSFPESEPPKQKKPRKTSKHLESNNNGQGE